MRREPTPELLDHFARVRKDAGVSVGMQIKMYESGYIIVKEKDTKKKKKRPSRKKVHNEV